jgi:hypothetical protein
MTMSKLNALSRYTKAIIVLLFPIFAKLATNLDAMSRHVSVDWSGFGWWALGAALLAFLTWLVPNQGAAA